MTIKRLFAISILFALAVGVWAADKPVSDDQLYDLVRRKLADDQVVKGGGLSVDVKDGVVTLGGKVENPKQKSKAEGLAKKVSGVKSVVNN